MYDTEIHHRRSIRAKGYDYAQDGAYFVTVCVHNRQHLFGDIANGKMELNGVGQAVDRWWHKLPEKFADVGLDEYVIMPNHFHGIIVICSVRAIPCNRPACDDINQNMNAGENMVSPVRVQKRIKNTYDGLGRYISWFKRMSANEYIQNVKLGKFPPFEKSVWQRNYWEHIVRDDDDLDRVREYIIDNPINWEIDELHSCAP